MRILGSPRWMLSLGLPFLLSACDSVTFATIVMESAEPLAVQCVQNAQQQLAGLDTFKVESVESGAARGSSITVTRRGRMVNAVMDADPPRKVETSFRWLGKSTPGEEFGSFRLLEDVQDAVMRACGVDASQVKITRNCRAVMCKEWLASHQHGG